MSEEDSAAVGVDGGDERKRESRLLVRTKNAGKQAIVFDEDEGEAEGHVATAIQFTGSPAKTWSPGRVAGAGADVRPHALPGSEDASARYFDQHHDDDNVPMRETGEEKAAAKSRGERIALRAARLREIEDRDSSIAASGFGSTFGGEHGGESPADERAAKGQPWREACDRSPVRGADDAPEDAPVVGGARNEEAEPCEESDEGLELVKNLRGYANRRGNPDP
jgi:hypothetical protein